MKLNVLFSMLVFAYSSLSLATENLGGKMGGADCAPGSMKICATKSQSRKVGQFNVNIVASAFYRDPGAAGMRTLTQVNFKVELDDFQNYFNPEGKVPVLARVILCRNTWGCEWRTQSLTFELNRIPDQRKLMGVLSTQFEQDWQNGEEVWVSNLELLLPGIGQSFRYDF